VLPELLVQPEPQELLELAVLARTKSALILK
jgi:hypothetical protein